jgi:hypothetical protein
MLRAAPKKRFGRWSALLSRPPDSTLPDAGAIVLLSALTRKVESCIDDQNSGGIAWLRLLTGSRRVRPVRALASVRERPRIRTPTTMATGSSVRIHQF